MLLAFRFAFTAVSRTIATAHRFQQSTPLAPLVPFHGERSPCCLWLASHAPKPLATTQDEKAERRQGLRLFRHRFPAKPEYYWRRHTIPIIFWNELALKLTKPIKKPQCFRTGAPFEFMACYSAGVAAGTVTDGTPAASRRPSLKIALISEKHIKTITTENGKAPITIAV